MKHIIISLVVLFFTQGFSQTESGSFTTAITKQYDYNYLLHKPKKSSSKKPLIIFLHGSGEKETI